jgi:gamma-glutamyltranspeptidase/glutathione hydrolase
VTAPAGTQPQPRPTLRACLAACLLAAGPLDRSSAPAPASRPAARGSPAGAVASGHVQATAAGLAMLRSGGNAVDAAVATALALAVVYPEAGNLGGGGFAVVKLGGKLAALDFRETAPAAARRAMFLDAGGRPRPGASTVGPLAAGVPGSPSGLYELHRALGKLAWAKVAAPAVRLARDGFEVDAHLHEVLAAEPQRRLLSRFPESAAVWLPGGQAPAAGTRLRLPGLAATLAAYAERGPAAITGGAVAAAVVAASRRHGGVLAEGDLAGYQPAWRQPLRFGAFGWQLATMPLPSAGGIVMGQSFGMLERLGWAALPRDGADRAHLLAEAFRRAFADRVLLGDPATSRATPADLLDPRWIAARAASIDRGRATPSAALAPWSAGAVAGAAPGGGGGETTHLSTVDGEGNAVALTTTLNGLFGCGLYVPEIGFLNNEMDDFATAPEAPGAPPKAAAQAAAHRSAGQAAGPNQSAAQAAAPNRSAGQAAAPNRSAGQAPAAHRSAGQAPAQGEANAVEPGKRMLSSMTPTIAWRGDELIVLGGRGSLRIPTHVTQVLLDLLVDHDALQAAVNRPRIHHQGLPDRLEAEPGALPAEAARELARRGHRIVIPAPTETSRVNAVRRLPGGRFEAAVDPRGAAAVGGAAVLAAAERPR